MTTTPREQLPREAELERLLSLSAVRSLCDYRRMAALTTELGRQGQRDWDSKDDAEFAALLAQYGSLREESIQSISNRVQVLMLGIAAIGVLAAGSLTISDPKASRDVVIAIFSGAIPLVCIFMLLVWATEAMRSARVGYFLASEVEARINHRLGRFVVNWEASLWAGAQKRDEMGGSSMMAFAVVGIIAFAAPPLRCVSQWHRRPRTRMADPCDPCPVLVSGCSCSLSALASRPPEEHCDCSVGVLDTVDRSTRVASA